MQLEYYGFSDKPFELSPDLRFLYLTAGYRIALEALCRGITDRKGLIALTGEVGTGKTMLIYGAMERLPKRVKTAFIFHSTYDLKELLQQIFSELEESVPTGGIDELKNQFLLHLNKLRDQGELLAILLDEAQKLSDEVIKGLFSLLEAESWVSEILQIVLVGQPELEETFNTAYMRYHPKINPVRIKINLLSREESLDYIEHRLKKVGRSSLGIFSPQALSMIVEKAGGIPRLINIICDNALFAGFKTSVKIIETTLIEEIIRNLEGPEYKLKKIKRPPLKKNFPRLSYRLFIRDGLIVLFGFTLVVGIFVFRPELTRQLKYFASFGEIKTLMAKAGHLVYRTQTPNANEKNSVNTPLTPIGQPTPDREKSREGQARTPPLSLIRKIQVKEGDFLSKIVVVHYGKINESLVDLVLNQNPSISNINLVLIDQQLKLPELTEESLIVPSPDGTFSIHLGTFPNEKAADKFKNLQVLKGKSIAVSLKKVSPTQTWYRVEAGTYQNRNEALTVIKTLKGNGLLSFFNPD